MIKFWLKFIVFSVLILIIAFIQRWQGYVDTVQAFDNIEEVKQNTNIHDRAIFLWIIILEFISHLYFFRQLKISDGILQKKYLKVVYFYTKEVSSRNVLSVLYFYIVLFISEGLKYAFNFQMSTHYICLTVINACYLNFIKQSFTNIIINNIGAWRLWNLRVLFGLFIGYGSINSYFIALYIDNTIECILGLSLGILGVWFIFADDDYNFTKSAQKQTNKYIYRTFFKQRNLTKSFLKYQNQKVEESDSNEYDELELEIEKAQKEVFIEEKVEDDVGLSSKKQKESKNKETTIEKEDQKDQDKNKNIKEQKQNKLQEDNENKKTDFNEILNRAKAEPTFLKNRRKRRTLKIDQKYR